MNTQQSEPQHHVDASKFSIPFFNNLICEAGGGAYWIAFEDQAIDTFISCGLDLIVASSQCEHPLATSVEILTRLAYSEEAMEILGQCSEVTLSWVSDNAGTKRATFLLFPEGTPFAHVQIVIHHDLAYVVFPCFVDWEGDSTNWNWLRQKIIDGILVGMDL